METVESANTELGKLLKPYVSTPGSTLNLIELRDALNLLPSHQILDVVLSVTHENGSTALHCAAGREHIQTAFKILDILSSEERVTLLSVQSQKGLTALYEAAYRSCSEIIKQMLDAIPQNQRIKILRYYSMYKYTVLHLSAKRGDIQTIKHIQESVRGEDRFELVNFLNSYNETPLHRAAKYGRTESIKYMLDNLKQDEQIQLLDQKDNFNRTPLEAALNTSHQSTAELIQQYRTAASNVTTATSGTAHFVHLMLNCVSKYSTVVYIYWCLCRCLVMYVY